MPELPEVESVVRGLRREIVGRKIKSVWIAVPKLIKGSSAEKFSRSIKDRKVITVRRRAKNILISLDGDYLLLIHLKMTGHLLLSRWKLGKTKAEPLEGGVFSEKVNGYIRVVFTLDDGRMLGFSDLRKFGKLRLGPEKEVISEEIGRVGPEATEITEKELKDMLKSSGRSIKQVLLDQTKIAGIGNIYSDDILWKAKIHPLRKANSLSDKEIKAVLSATKEILALAISLGGTSISDYRDVEGLEGRYGNRRLVYDRDKEPCFRCKTPIEKLKIGGRTSRFCPKCQVVTVKKS